MMIPRRNTTAVIVLASGILYVLSVPFLPGVPLRILCAVALAFPVRSSLKRYFSARGAISAREELRSLMENLCASVASGHVLPNALAGAIPDMILLFGERSPMVKALNLFSEKIRLGHPFQDSLKEFSGSLRCPEAMPLFDALTRSDLLGGKMLLILRHNLTMISELLSVSRDISSDVSRKRAESTIMSGMPFLVLWCLYAGARDYVAMAWTDPAGRLCFFFAFVVSVLAYCMSMSAISSSVYADGPAGKAGDVLSVAGLLGFMYRTLFRKSGKARRFLSLAGRSLPEGFLLSRKRMLLFLYPEREDPLEEYLFVKITLAALTVLFFALTLPWAGRAAISMAAIPLAMLFLHDLDLQRRIACWQTRIMRDVPGFISLLSTLLGNGMTLSRAVGICMDAFADSSVEFRREMSFLKKAAVSGMAVSDALDVFAGRMMSASVSGALILAAQYGRTGGTETLSMLRLQAGACWQQARLAARRQLEETSLTLLLPMMIQLICVLLISALPALITIGNI